MYADLGAVSVYAWVSACMMNVRRKRFDTFRNSARLRLYLVIFNLSLKYAFLIPSANVVSYGTAPLR